ncbi:unnamed protein product [Chrysoparadoxa australica]
MFLAFSFFACFLLGVDSFVTTPPAALSTKLDAVITTPAGLGGSSAAAYEFFPHPADKVWAVLSDWSGPYITASEAPVSITSADPGKVGATRMLTDGETSFKEELTSLDSEAMTFTYKFVSDSPFPVDKYGGLVTVEKVTDTTCKAIWVGYCDMTDGLEVKDISLDGLYQSFLDAAQKQLA